MDAARVARQLDAWFARHARRLPWRLGHDPYEVLLAEFVLQQTRMEAGLAYFLRLRRRFPDVRALARARESTVVAAWSGLGYYSRARNLHRTARAIVRAHGGRVPDDVDVLRTLPGIGPYTAGAVASIAYDRPEPSLDGNQYRVLGRVLGKRPPATAAARRAYDGLARQLLAKGSPRRLNQALMDLGSSVCLPRSPRCGVCPLAAACRSRGRLGRSRPPSRRAVPEQDMDVVLHRRGSALWMRPPSGRGLLGALWSPPIRRVPRRNAPPDLVHAFSHRRWRVRWTRGRGNPSGPGRFVTRAALDRLPHGALARRAFEAAGLA